MTDKVSFTSTINFVPHTKYKQIVHRCQNTIESAVYGQNGMFRQIPAFNIKTIRTCSAFGINDAKENALGSHIYDCLNNKQHLKDILSDVESAINWKPEGGLLIGSKTLNFRPYSRPIYMEIKEFMLRKIPKVSYFEEHLDTLSETDLHYDVKKDIWTICTRGFDKNNEKIISVSNIEDLKSRFRKIHIADGDILMINGEKVKI